MMKILKRFSILFFISIFLYSCENRLIEIPAISEIPLLREIAARFSGGAEQADKSAETAALTTQTNNATAHLNHDDEELVRIAETARDTLPDFFRRLLRSETGEGGFCLKYPFRADSESPFGMEQLWLTDITFKNGVYYGVIANTPFYIQSMKKGNTVSFSADGITDWMYTANGKITGGRSVKYLLEQIAGPDLSEEQRAVLKMFE